MHRRPGAITSGRPRAMTPAVRGVRVCDANEEPARPVIGSGTTETNVVAAVTSFALNGTCGGSGGTYRVDQADDLDWLATFGITPQ